MRTTTTLKHYAKGRLRDTIQKQAHSPKKGFASGLSSNLCSKPATKRKKFTLPTYNMGPASMDLTKANAIAAEMEDQEIIRKLQLGK